MISLAYIIQIQSAAWYMKFLNVMLGSTASGVLLKSKVPVLVARPE